MRARGWVGLIGLVLVTGCALPSREARSAGKIGCAPEDITISDEQRHFGLLQSDESWVAECHDRTFICSQLNVNDRDGSSVRSEQVSCTEEAESPQEQRNREALASARENSPAPRQQAPAPAGAAGFDFGEAADDAQHRCEVAGNRWNALVPELPTCSGAAVDVGIPVSVGLSFCGGRACGIALEHRPVSHFATSVVELKTKLEAKYGPAQASSGVIPTACRSDSAFAHCLDTTGLTLHYRWRWASGEALDMIVGKPTAADASSIQLVYSRGGSANVSAL